MTVLAFHFHVRQCDGKQCTATQKCAWWEFQCANGNCVNIINFCDGIIDCADGSDEIIAKSKEKF